MTQADPPYRHPRRGLIWPFLIVGLLLAFWTGWWFFLTRQVEAQLVAQGAALSRSGWTVAHAPATTTGWPFRARVSIPHVQIIAPSGHGVSAPELVAQANAWNPDRWVVVAPDGLTLSRAGKGKVAVRAEAVRLSVSRLTARFPDLRVQAVEPVFTPHPDADPFPIASAAQIEFYARPHAGNGAEADAMDVLFRLIDARGRRDGPVEAATRQGRLTAEVEATVVEASRLSGADAAGVFATWSEAGGRLTNVRGQLSAGESRARLESAALQAGPDGRLVGEMALSAERPMEAIAGLAGSPSGEVNRAGAAGAAAAAGGAPDDRPVDLVLRFEKGRTWLGPFALAPAPKLF